MPRPTIITLTPDAANLTEFGDDVTGDSFVLTNNNTSDGLAHIVTILNNSATDYQGITITLTGKDQDGITVSDVVTGPAGTATVESAVYFKQLDSAVPSSTIGADTFDIGMADEVAMKTYPSNYHNASTGLVIDVTGTIDWTLQHTGDEIQKPRSGNSFVWQNHTDADLVDQTISRSGNYAFGIGALRLVVNSYTAPGSVTIAIRMSDNS